MPVQSEYYCKVKPVCDHLAVLASHCHENEFEQRFNVLSALCKSWTESDANQLTPVLPLSSASVAEPDDTKVSHENMPQQYAVDTVTCLKDNDSLTNHEIDKQTYGDSTQRIIGNCSSVHSVTENCDMQNSAQYNGSLRCRNLASDSHSALHKWTSVQDVTNRHIKKCPYVCCFCCKQFKSSTKLLQHLKSHNYCVLTKNSKHPTLKEVANKVVCAMNGASIRELNMLTCKDCNKRFRTAAKLQTHIRSCHKVLQHLCPHCGNRCQSARELRAHLRSCHASAGNKYYCDVCCQCFGRSVDLRSHRQLTHGGLKTRNGTQSKTGHKRSLHCKDCGADSFKTWRSLTIHRRTHHGGPLPHSCSQCPRRFVYASDLRKHEFRHTGQRPHVCTVCGKGFFHMADLEVHGRAHRGDVPLTCGVCNKWMSSMTGLRAHMHIHRPNARTNFCTICNKQFSYLSSLYAHMKRQHAATAKNTSYSDSWRCVNCNVEFSSLSLLHGHFNSCRHNNSQNKTPTDRTVDKDADAGHVSTVKTEQSFVDDQSDMCSSQLFNESLECSDAVTDSHRSIWPQSIISNGNNPDILGNSTAGLPNNSEQYSSLLRRWQLKYPGRKIEPHTCTTCGKQFLQGVQLRKHMIKHASADDEDNVEFPYTCYVCRRHFLFANDLRRHLISHSNERPYSCMVCTRPFKREDDLTKHMKMHAGVRPYRCEECSEQMESSSKLRKHMRKVHGDRFECRLCRMFFAKRSQLNMHRREQHADVKDSVVVGAVVAYVCDRCGKSFSYEADLRNHMYTSHARRRPPVHVCAWCNRQFSSTSHLASHERIHTGDRPFTCDTCGKQFTQSGSLNVHRRTHVEPQPFPCHVCGQRFASKQYAKKHHAMRHADTSQQSDIA